MSVKQLMAVIAGALLIAGCTGTPKPKPATLKDFKSSLKASVAWKVDLGKAAKSAGAAGQFVPAVSGDAVYAASSAGTVSKISLADGKLIWRAPIGAPLVSGIAVGSGSSEGVTAVVSDRAELVIISAEGKIERRIALGGVVLEAPVMAGSTAVVRLADNRVAGFDIVTGNRRWVLQRNLPTLVLHGQSGMRVQARPAEESASSTLGPSDVLVNMPGGRLLWLDAASGAIRWESQVATPRGSNEVERIVDLLGMPSVEGADVCVAAYQTSIVCLGAESGRRLWSRELTAMSTLAVDGRYVFFADDQSRLHSLNRKDGQSVWTIDTFQLRGLQHPVSWGRAVWVADSFGFLHALAREDGKQIARLSLDGGAPSGAIRPTRAGLLIQTQGGQLLLIRSEG
ncbi:MAG: outer membrane protein assembly factor BamB [Betaproteobacteria bacterium]|jgi:outer membrane protein assembly factor BamB|nr:outer membrane protein assembly factor BamB [Betaproteobacteria bacterium]